MNAIIYLKRIKKMDMKIKVAMEELAQLEALATKTSVAMGDERIQSSGSQQKMADCVVKIADAKNEINKEVEELTRCKNEAMQILSNCDAECIAILHKRYFQFKTWEQIAAEMGFTYKWVSGGLHQKALAQFQKTMDEMRDKPCD